MDSLKSATEYVDAQLAIMRRYGSLAPDFDEAYRQRIIEEIVAAIPGAPPPQPAPETCVHGKAKNQCWACWGVDTRTKVEAALSGETPPTEAPDTEIGLTTEELARARFAQTPAPARPEAPDHFHYFRGSYYPCDCHDAAKRTAALNLISNREPTADEIRRGLELEPEALAALARNEERRAARPEAGARELAQKFHETYEFLAPQYGYTTRAATAVPWEQLPENNRRLMEATCDVVMAYAQQQIAHWKEASGLESPEDLEKVLDKRFDEMGIGALGVALDEIPKVRELAEQLAQREQEWRTALSAILPFAKAHACQHNCLGKSCPWCVSIKKAEALL